MISDSKRSFRNVVLVVKYDDGSYCDFFCEKLRVNKLQNNCLHIQYKQPGTIQRDRIFPECISFCVRAASLILMADESSSNETETNPGFCAESFDSLLSGIGALLVRLGFVIGGKVG